MPTFGYMVEETLGLLRGYARSAEQATHLTSAISSSDLSFTVADASQLSRGIAEIGEELVWIESVDRLTNSVTLAPYGRGYGGSAASAHDSLTKITFTPLFPRMRVKRALNDTVISLRGSLVGQASMKFTFNGAQFAYQMPSNAQEILRLQAQTLGPTKVRHPINAFRLDLNADRSDFPTGKAIEIYEPVTPGLWVQVWYTTYPDEMVYDSDDFADTTTLEESARDVVVLGACARLAAAVDPSRLNTHSIEADTMDAKTDGMSGTQVAQYLQMRFERRRDEELRRQQAVLPAGVRYTS